MSSFHLSKACLRRPGPEMIRGLSQTFQGVPDFERAMLQHEGYVKALELAGVRALIAPALPQFPDGCFVEDTHLVLPELVIRLHPGALSRKEEPESLSDFLPQDRPSVAPFLAPFSESTIDGGDILRVGQKIYVGVSERTELKSVDQIKSLLSPYGYSVNSIPVPKLLHLKSGMTALTSDTFIVLPSFAEIPAVRSLGKIFIPPPEEARAANILPINQSVLIPSDSPKTKSFIQEVCPHLRIIEVDTSEFAKLDGALTCLSLLW